MENKDPYALRCMRYKYPTGNTDTEETMTGQEHYDRAEKLLENADMKARQSTITTDAYMGVVNTAQVHATLAVAYAINHKGR